VDAFAAPFVQGRLQERDLAVTVRSACAHCDDPLTIELTSGLRVTVRGDDNPRPMIFVPDVNLPALKDPSIIDAF